MCYRRPRLTSNLGNSTPPPAVPALLWQSCGYPTAGRVATAVLGAVRAGWRTPAASPWPEGAVQRTGGDQAGDAGPADEVAVAAGQGAAPATAGMITCAGPWCPGRGWLASSLLGLGLAGWRCGRCHIRLIERRRPSVGMHRSVVTWPESEGGQRSPTSCRGRDLPPRHHGDEPMRGRAPTRFFVLSARCAFTVPVPRPCRCPVGAVRRRGCCWCCRSCPTTRGGRFRRRTTALCSRRSRSRSRNRGNWRFPC
jgi:hypothetical protein